MRRIIYYKSVFCPRCWLTDRRLAELKAVQPEVEIETIEILTDPSRALRDGVWMIPTIIMGDKRWHYAPTLAELQAALGEQTVPTPDGLMV